jgi:2-dehydro-3-deoxyphosphogluconate aldolase/(4S)-4-hydroxy-2-oxoglutarate aldolase
MEFKAKHQILAKLGTIGIVPVVAIEHLKDAISLGQALLDGGLPCAEITFRTAAAEDAIRRISSELPDILIGAGTVLNLEQAEKAVDSGAQFIVSPGFDYEVVNWCLKFNVPITPGIATPTEINMALAKGIRILKYFPAESLGGIKTLRAIAAPYQDVKFIPTGGIDARNLAEYLSLPMVHACGGSWLVKKNLISGNRFVEITKLVQEALSIVNEVRK